MGPWPPTVGRFFRGSFRALSWIQAHHRIERVAAPLPGERVMKFAAGKAFKGVRQGEAACVDKSRNQKINFPI